MKKIYGYVLKTGKTLRETHPVLQFAAFVVFSASILAIFLVTRFVSPADRHIFYYTGSSNQRVMTEVRYLSEKDDDDQRLEQFVSELLLGPITPEFAPLFEQPVLVRSCFIRGSDAYINLTGAEEAFIGNNPPPDRAFEIFKKNVFTNFRNLAKIYLYIDGIEVYAESPSFSDGQP